MIQFWKRKKNVWREIHSWKVENEGLFHFTVTSD